RSQILDFFPYVSALYDVKNDRQEFRGGMDMFWKPSGDFQLTAASSGFRPGRVGELVVNFDAIETFYSDKRPFFTENQGLFDLRTPQGGRILYTRRVGGPSDDDSGRAADIDAAVKLNGNAGRLKYGLFLADEADDAGRQFTAARLLYTPDTVGVGLLVTDVERLALDRHATVSTTDLRWQLNERFQLNGQILLLYVESGDHPARGRARDWCRLQRRRRRHHEASLAHYDAQLDFNDAGYLPRNSLNELRWTSYVKVNDRPAESSVAAIDYGADIRYSTNTAFDYRPRSSSHAKPLFVVVVRTCSSTNGVRPATTMRSPGAREMSGGRPATGSSPTTSAHAATAGTTNPASGSRRKGSVAMPCSGRAVLSTALATGSRWMRRSTRAAVATGWCGSRTTSLRATSAARGTRRSTSTGSPAPATNCAPRCSGSPSARTTVAATAWSARPASPRRQRGRLQRQQFRPAAALPL
ncbi:DUF5916 domain-containing protein, partial [Paucibacter sp. O1-1]|nr:DUF5916 domain-containing protein [Paucibacter sp. O1-1]MDA3829995.1 DUF5916 domain-containing protein [Paucibacter sp. O1-1]